MVARIKNHLEQTNHKYKINNLDPAAVINQQKAVLVAPFRDPSTNPSLCYMHVNGGTFCPCLAANKAVPFVVWMW